MIVLKDTSRNLSETKNVLGQIETIICLSFKEAQVDVKYHIFVKILVFLCICRVTMKNVFEKMRRKLSLAYQLRQQIEIIGIFWFSLSRTIV